jgi:CelD/BcsL family acetyltransferase involved in cellulose biosynthesis
MTAAASVLCVGLTDVRFGALRERTDALYAEWLALWQAEPAARRVPWAHPQWVLAWLDCYARASGHDYRLFFVSHGAQLVAVFALRVVMRRGVLQLELADDAVLGGADPVLAEGGRVRTALPEGPPGGVDTRAVVDALLRTPVHGGRAASVLLLRTVDAGHPLLSAGVPAFVVPADRRSVIDLLPDHAAYLASLGRNFRGNLRKARNRLHAAGAVRVEAFDTAHTIGLGLHRFATMDQGSWKAEAGSSLQGNARIMALYGESLPPMAARGEAVVHLLSLDGRDIGGTISHVAGDTLFVQKISYVKSCAEFAPGNMLLEHLLEHDAAARGLTRVNLVTCQPWHANWRPSYVQGWEVYCTRRGASGTLAAWRAVPLRKRLKASLLAEGGAGRLGRVYEALRRLRDRG